MSKHTLETTALLKFKREGVTLDPAAVPEELRKLKRWLGWRPEPLQRRDGTIKIAKRPRDPATGLPASKTDPAAWRTFADITDAIAKGVIYGGGLCIAPDDELVCVDIDNALDPGTREWKPWAASIVEALDAFTEVSPSGTGLHVWCTGWLPPDAPTSVAHHDGKVEIYRAGAFVTVTAKPPAGLDHGTLVAERTGALLALLDKMRPGWREQKPEETSAQGRGQDDDPGDEDDLRLVMTSLGWKSKCNLHALWNGDFTGFPSQSEADFALCQHLAFLLGKDALRVDRAFRRSGLFRPKWDEMTGGSTYGMRTIEKAIGTTKNTFTSRPVVRIDKGKLDQAADDTEVALAKTARKEHLMVFQRGPTLVRIIREALPGKDGPIRGVASLLPVAPVNLLDTASRHIQFEKFDGRADAFVACDPPERLLNLIVNRGSWDHLPIMKALVLSPTMLMDGTLLNSAGHHAASGLYLASHLKVQVPDNPNREDAIKAASRLHDLLGNFPFETEDDVAAGIALVLTAIMRPVLPRCPLFAVSAPLRGSGKSHLIDTASVLATGRCCPAVAYTRDEDELKKHLSAILMKGAPIINVDNVNSEFRSDLVAQAITGDRLDVRILGKSETLELPNTSLWAVNGNNLIIAEDLSRRTLGIRLDPGVERPEEQLYPFCPVARAKERRAGYVGDALTVLRAFHLAGLPAQEGEPWAGFEDWSVYVRGAIQWIGMSDPCKTRKRIIAEDPVADLLGRFLESWQEEFGNRDTTIKEATAKARAKEDSALAGVLDDICEERGSLNSKRLGKWMGRHVGRVVHNRRLEKRDIFGGYQRWRVINASSSS